MQLISYIIFTIFLFHGDHKITHIISENLEAHIEEHSYSANNDATDRYAITGSRIIA